MFGGWELISKVVIGRNAQDGRERFLLELGNSRAGIVKVNTSLAWKIFWLFGRAS